MLESTEVDELCQIFKCVDHHTIVLILFMILFCHSGKRGSFKVNITGTNGYLTFSKESAAQAFKTINNNNSNSNSNYNNSNNNSNKNKIFDAIVTLTTDSLSTIA